MSLKLYNKKRSFNKTPEPSGQRKVKGDKVLIFVVQKHHASHLHYDFRLELKGVLKSWAVPKGPSMNPVDKRLAMHVEDHPYDYRDFEGIIPPGNYGAGTVIVWDTGTFSSLEKPDAPVEEQEKQLLKEYYAGNMKLLMKGKKIKGAFALVKTSGDEKSWLLIKKKDQYSSSADITRLDKSVLSKKTLEQVAASSKSKQWQSNRKAKIKEKELVEEKKPVKKKAQLRGRKTPYPKDLRPMLATLTDDVVEGAEWSYEIKWDGYRALGYINNGKAELRSRNNKSFNDQFYPVLQEAMQWKVKAVVDGEIVAVDDKGISSFQMLQNWRSEADGELLYYLFDILWLDGKDLTSLPLEERREILQEIIPSNSIIRYSESFQTPASEFMEVAKKLGMEGIIAKRTDSEYTPGLRTKNWLKIKTGQRHEAIICGYTKNEDTSKYFSSLILGIHDKKGKLNFIGQVGTGFNTATQKDILAKLKPLIVKDPPFDEKPEVNRPTRFRPRPPKAEVTWVKPKLVCEVQYQELTNEGIMRHPSFQGLRIDKSADEVKVEEKIDISEKPVKEEKIKKRKEVETKNKAEKELSKKITRLPKGERKTLLNPHEETQVKKINGRELKFTNLSKIYWPKEKISKRDMLNYYYQVVPYMLPYMKDRPQSLNRYPNGINGPSFYQKNVKDKVPSWIATHDYENRTSEGGKQFLVCADEATLLYIANLGCIEMNPWHSRYQNPDNPDWCVIDLDPDTNSFEQVIEAAQVVKNILDAADIPSYPKTSGSTGIHILIPLGAKYDYEQSKSLAELIVVLAHREIPSFTSLERTPSKRKGKIYLDFLQNRHIQTIAAPYSLRPKPGATVSAPLDWSEVKPGLKISDFNIHNMLDRIRSVGDIYKGVMGRGIDLEKVLTKLNKVFG